MVSVRKLTNCVEILKKYSKEFGFEDDAEYIETEIKRYKEFVSDHLTDFEYLQKSEGEIRKYGDNIGSKCDQVIANLYI